MMLSSAHESGYTAVFVTDDGDDKSELTRSARPHSFRAPPHTRARSRQAVRPRNAPSRSSSSLPPADDNTTARAALEAGGVARLRVLAAVMLLLIQVGMVSVALLNAERFMKQVAWGALVTLLGLFLFSWLRLEQTSSVAPGEVRRVAIPLSLAVVVANFAFGLQSAFSAAVTLGLMLFASSVSRRDSRLAFFIVAGGYIVSALIARFDLEAYRPLTPTRYATPWQWDAGAITVLCLYFTAYVAGRMMRRENARAVEQLERAVREAAYRDALFREARDALKQAAGIGGPGRFTDQELAGYRLGEVIGRGGMGEVYGATRREDGSEAAVKLLRLDFLADRGALSRFAREAQIVTSISSPHVVRVLEVGGPDAVLPYIAMERLEGTDLGSYLREHGRMGLDEVCDMVRQVAAGLEAAHAGNIVHRDLKPSNIFRASTEESHAPVWKVLDFGVSKLNGGLDITLTAHELIGTPQYMAPEQARGERELDARSDIYGLAAIAYRALTGEPPFTGEFPGLLQRILDSMPAAPSSRASLPSDVDFVLAIGLAKQRDDRFATAGAFARALSQAARGELELEERTRATTLLKGQPYAA